VRAWRVTGEQFLTSFSALTRLLVTDEKRDFTSMKKSRERKKKNQKPLVSPLVGRGDKQDAAIIANKLNSRWKMPSPITDTHLYLSWFVMLNGLYDISCAISILIDPSFFLSTLHLHMFDFIDGKGDGTDSGDENIYLSAFRRFLAYWILTYGVIRLVGAFSVKSTTAPDVQHAFLSSEKKKKKKKKTTTKKQDDGIVDNFSERSDVNAIALKVCQGTICFLIALTYYIEGLVFLHEMWNHSTIMTEKGVFVVVTSFLIGGMVNSLV
jgi:hypothetical protein